MPSWLNILRGRVPSLQLTDYVRPGSGGKALYHLQVIAERMHERKVLDKDKHEHTRDQLKALNGSIGRRRRLLLQMGYDVPDDLRAVLAAIAELEPIV